MGEGDSGQAGYQCVALVGRGIATQDAESSHTLSGTIVLMPYQPHSTNYFQVFRKITLNGKTSPDAEMSILQSELNFLSLWIN